MTAAERALNRIKHAMKEHKISQRVLAERLNTSQPRIAKILKKGVHLRVDDLERLAEAVGVQLVETIRNRGSEFYAEMTPTELRLLERLRENADLERAVLLLIQAAEVAATRSRLRLRNQLQLGKVSGRNLTSTGDFPDARHGLSASQLAALQLEATDLSLRLARFATGGSEPRALSTPKTEKP